MQRSRVAVLVFGTALAVGGFASTAVARSDDSTSSTSTPSTSTPASTEVEAQTPTAGGSVTLTVAGVGTVTLTVDPTTAAISDVVVTPIDGVTTGAPVATPDGVKIQVTAADGTVRVLEIKARHEDAGLEVETELGVENHDVNDDRGNDNGDNQGDRSGPNRGPGTGQAGEQGNRGADDGPNHETTATTGVSGVFSPGTTGDDHGANSGHDGGGDDASGSGGGHSGRG
jgi:hypothetical protein